ncbi:MAG: phytanoyl-CoA dioxygenase family protein [Gemmataceae bacterium]|nr:phytanoyl-CoA dioxygenase family protein [Gemmataceae bacterium]
MTDLADAVARWAEHGFVVLAGWVPAAELEPARRELADLYPPADEFHTRPDDPRAAKLRGDEFAGITPFPFPGPELGLLAVHPRLVALAEALLGTADVRLYSAEAWAKYTGAADYDQPLHRDYLNHTLLAPADDPAFRQVELFLYLCDVPEELGPPHFVSKTLTRGTPAFPNWLSRDERPEWYAAEASAAGPAGTVVAYEVGTFHRGTGLTAPGGVRYTLHASYRPAGAEWAGRIAWADRSHEPGWYAFARRATARQLLLFGFPPPGHPYWTATTWAAVAARYPGADLTAFQPS